MVPIVWAVIPAGGKGLRYANGTGANKLMAMLLGKPVLCWTIAALAECSDIAGLVLVVPAGQEPLYREMLAQFLPELVSGKAILFCEGGNDRRESVYKGLKILPSACTVALIHDAARPLLRENLLQRCLKPILSEAVIGCVAGLPLHDTVKRILPETMTVLETLDRTELWRVQTPQVFLRAALVQAHEAVSKDISVTDDVQLLELSGLGNIRMIPGDPHNLKITEPDDLRLASFLLAKQSELSGNASTSE